MEKSFVGFMEAMKALKNGKRVRFYDSDGYFNTVFHFELAIDENGIEMNSFKDLIEGNWLILEED